MKNEMNEIPTPETDAAIKTVGLYRGDEMEIVDPEFARDLERRLNEVKRLERERNETANTFMGQVKKLQAKLAVAREALQAVSDAGGNYCDLLTSQGISEKALTLTAPKQ